VTTSQHNKQRGWLLVAIGIIAMIATVLVDAASDGYAYVVWVPGIIGVMCISFGVAALCRTNRTP